MLSIIGSTSFVVSGFDDLRSELAFIFDKLRSTYESFSSFSPILITTCVSIMKAEAPGVTTMV
jgi:hypothetical protein